MTWDEQESEEDVADFAKYPVMDHATLVRELGKRIAELRKRKGWTRIDLASKLGVPRDRLSKWEQGESAPPLRMLVALHWALGTSLDELITGERDYESSLSRAGIERMKQHIEELSRLLGLGCSELP